VFEDNVLCEDIWNSDVGNGERRNLPTEKIVQYNEVNLPTEKIVQYNESDITKATVG
jgi:hypothetical protein